MGRFNRKIKKARTEQKKEDGRDDRDYEQNTFVRENAAFEAYYKKQGLIPEEEFDAFMASLKTPLPSTFRITGSRQTCQAVLKHLTDTLIPSLPAVSEDGAALPVPNAIPWYPEGLAWNMVSDRKAIRSQPAYAAFHEWLKAAMENGDISRQEAVSMIPALFLDVQPDHLVLDLCAAPGSKTAQIVEQMHARCPSGQIPTGLVIANDVDQKRAYLLHHQVKRILSPCLVVSNNDGGQFPSLFVEGQDEAIQFDRILADVPCSGDGTMRKNPGIWREWNTGNGLGLHALQVRLLDRALQMVKAGGRVVYSTCSMNPIEDEAVVAWLLNKYPGKVRLVQVELAGLKSLPGVPQWKVTSRDGASEFGSMEDVPEAEKKRYWPSMFPLESYATLNLDRCMRVLPHLQDTGGFFIAVLEKVEDFAARPTRPVVTKTEVTIKDEDLVVVPKDHHNLLDIMDKYGIASSAVESVGFVTRGSRDPLKTISMVSSSAHAILRCSQENKNLRLVNVGARAFEIYDVNQKRTFDCAYRILSESAGVLEDLAIITKRRVEVSSGDLVRLLQAEDSVPIEVAIEDETARAAVRGWTEGGLVLVAKDAMGNPAVVPVWKGEKSLKSFVPKANRPALLYQLQ